MRLFLFCLICLYPAVQIFAQETFPYQWFHPDQQYLYARPISLSPDANLLGMRLETPVTASDTFSTYRSLYALAADGFCHSIVPSFAGRQVVQRPGRTTLLLHLEGTDSLVIRNAAAAGTTWPAGRELLARVDSVREENFLGVTDSVKYLGFTNLNSGEPVGPSVRVSRSYGLLTGTYFWRLAEDAEPLELYATEAIDPELELPTFDNVLDLATGDQLDTYRRSITVNDESTSYYTTNVWQKVTAGMYTADPSGLENTLSVTIEEYRYDVERDDPDMTPFNAQYTAERQEAWRVNEDHRWIDGQPGEYLDAVDGPFGIAVVVEAKAYDCFGVGKRVRFFNGDDNCFYDFSEGDVTPSGYYFARAGGAYFARHFGRPEGYDLLGKVTGSDSCGINRPLQDLFVSANEHVYDARIVVYPNPVDARLMVSVPFDLGSTHLLVYDIAGRLVAEAPAESGDRWLSVEEMPPGVYTVVVNGREGPVARRKVVVR